MFLKKSNSSKHSIQALNCPTGEDWDIFNKDMIKTASIDKSKEVELSGFDLEAAVKDNPDHLFVKVFAIKKDEVNDNGDAFSEEELKKACHTFIGVPVFVNHQNDDIEKARGKVVHAWYDDEKGGIYTINMVDKTAYPRLARGIQEKYVIGTSMGAQVGYSLCSICHNKASTSDEYCSHIKNKKTRLYNGSENCSYHKSASSPDGSCPICGCEKGSLKKNAFKEEKIFEWNYDIKFIEDSFVVNPACHDCLVCDVLNPVNFSSKVANAVSEIKTSINNMEENDSLSKVAGVKEIEDLNEAMNLLEKVSRSMMAQKQQVSMEYVSEIVDVLADIQNVSDELIEMGYAKLPSPSAHESQFGNDKPASPMDQNTATQVQDPNSISSLSSQPMSQPMSQPAPANTGNQSSLNFSNPLEDQLEGGVGTVTKPTFISASKEKKEDFLAKTYNIIEKLNKISKNIDYDNQKVSNVREKYSNSMENNTNIISEKDGYKVLISTDNHGETYISKFNNNNLLSVSNIDSFDKDFKNKIINEPRQAANYLLNETIKESASMDKNEKVAAGSGVKESQTESVTESQLQDSKLDLHNRQNSHLEETIEGALGDKGNSYSDTTTDSPHIRRGTYETITEAQMESVKDGFLTRWHDMPDVITEKQWDEISRSIGAILPEDYTEAITQIQLDSLRNNHSWVDAETITEDQMKDAGKMNKGEIGRWASSDNSSILKSAMSAASDAIAYYGMTPSELSSTIDSVVNNPRNAVKASYLSLINSVPVKIENRNVEKNRSNYFKSASTKISNLSNYDRLISAIADNLGNLNSEKVVAAMNFLISNSDAFNKVESIAQEKIANKNSDKEVKVSFNDQLKQAFAEMERPEDGMYKVCGVVGEDVDSDPEERYEFIRSIESFAQSKVNSPATLMEINYSSEDNTFEAILKDNSMLTDEERVAAEKFASLTEDEMVKMSYQHDEDEEEDEDYDEDMFLDDCDDVKKESSSRRQEMLKEAQLMGGQMGGQGGVSQAPGAGSTLPQPPAEEAPVESFSDQPVDDPMNFEPEDTASDLLPKPPGSICPVCSSEDVDVVSGKSKCNNCGSEFLIKVQIDVMKWSDLTEDAEEGGDEMPEGEGFSMEDEPASLPVAAVTRLTPNALKKMASSNIKLGHVSPLTGSTETVNLGNNEFFCLQSGTKYKVSLASKGKDNKNIFAQWEWEPKNSNMECTSCRRAKISFAKALDDSGISTEKFDSLDLESKGKAILSMYNDGKFNVKTASVNKNTNIVDEFKNAYSVLGGKFPIESCREKLARRFGENALAISGPCEGNNLADCVCNQLKSANVYNDYLAVKVAEAWCDSDGTLECFEDYIRSGLNTKQAAIVCDHLKAKYASPEEMFAEELENMSNDNPDNDMDGDLDNEGEEMMDSGFDSDEDPFESDGTDTESITIELPLDLINELEEKIDMAKGIDPSMEEHHQDVPEGEGEIELSVEVVDSVEDAAEDALEEASDIQDSVEEEMFENNDELEEESEDDLLNDSDNTEDLMDSEEDSEEVIEDEVMEDSDSDEDMDDSDGSIEDEVEENDDLYKEGDEEEMSNDELENIERNAYNMRPGKIVGNHKIALDVNSILAAINKQASESTLEQQNAQDDSDIAPIKDGKTMGNEENFDADSPNVPEGKTKALIGKEDSERHPGGSKAKVPHGGGEMGHEKEQGYTAEKGNKHTGGENGQGKSTSASAKVNKSAGNKKLDPSEPLDKDKDIQPVQGNKDHKDTPEKLKRTPHSDKDNPNVPEGNDSAFMGKEKDALDSVPKSPKDHPEFPVGGGKNPKYDKNNDPEKGTKNKGTVIAGGDEESGVKKAAARIAGRMLKANRIGEGQLLDKIEELSQYKLSQLQDLENMMFAKKGLDSVPKGSEKALVISAESNVRNSGQELTNSLKNLFTLEQRNQAAENSEMDISQIRRLYDR